MDILIFLKEGFIMDWRGRKYYVARFLLCSYDMRMDILKDIEKE